MTMHSKDRRAGYQGQPDAMRDMADRLMDHPGNIEEGASAFKARQFFKKGGRVMKKGCATFAAGGVAKIRHQQANAKGLPLAMPKRSMPRGS